MTAYWLRLYRSLLGAMRRSERDRDLAALKVLVTLSLLEALALAAAAIWVEVLGGPALLDRLSRAGAGVAFVAVLGGNFWALRSSRVAALSEELDARPKPERQLPGWAVGASILGPMGFFVSALIALAVKVRGSP